jgi:hypothetical protein
MKLGRFLPLAIVALTTTASAQDWEHCKPDGSYSFAEVKDAVRRVTTNHMIEGWDVKTFNRSGDMVTVAIVQTLDDKEMTSPQTLEEVLLILRDAFACAVRCNTSSADRQPRVALLLLEHLHNNTVGEMRSSVDDTREFILQQGRPSD